MRIILGNVKKTMALNNMSPTDDIGTLLTEIVPTWYSWNYIESSDILTVDFNIQVSQRIVELGEVVSDGITVG